MGEWNCNQEVIMCSIKVVQTSFCTKPKPSFNCIIFFKKNFPPRFSLTEKKSADFGKTFKKFGCSHLHLRKKLKVILGPNDVI